jgi:Leucine-rich repeat (LRR) protein
MPNLRHLLAKDNFISEIKLTLPFLMTLDLSENKFRRFPLLNDLVNLNNLNLNSNDIENFKPDFKGPSCLTLKSLDIG